MEKKKNYNLLIGVSALVIIVLIIAFFAVFLINMFTGTHMKNIRKW